MKHDTCGQSLLLSDLLKTKWWADSDDEGYSPYSPRISGVQPLSRDIPLPAKKHDLTEREKAFLKSIIEHPLLTTAQRYRSFGKSVKQAHIAREKLEAAELIRPATISTKTGRLVLLELTNRGRQLMNLAIHRPLSAEHRYWHEQILATLKEHEFHVQKEQLEDGYAPDIIAEKNGITLIIEIETGKSNFEDNCRRAVQRTSKMAGRTAIMMLATTATAREKLISKLPERKDVHILLSRDFPL